MWDSRSALCHWLVAAAARGVGMTRASAYRRRDREGAESFAAAWDRVLTPPGSGHLPAPTQDSRKVTLQELIRGLETDLVQPVIYRGGMCKIRRKTRQFRAFPAAAADRWARRYLRVGVGRMSAGKFCKTPRSVVHGWPDDPPHGKSMGRM